MENLKTQTLFVRKALTNMSDTTYAEQLASIVKDIGVTEVIRVTSGSDRITVLFRITSKFPDGRIDERPLLTALERLILHDPEGKGPWFSHVCSQLLPKQGEDGKWKMVKGWSISIQSKNFGVDLMNIKKLLKGETLLIAPLNSKSQLDEIPLFGATAHGNSPPGKGPGAGKGATFTVARR